MKFFVILLLSLSLASSISFDFIYAESNDFRFLELSDSYFLGDKITIKFEKITQQPCPSYEISMMKTGFPESTINVGVEPLCAIHEPVESYLFSGDLERQEFFDSAGTYIIKVKLDNETIQKEIKIIDSKTALKDFDGFFTIREKQVRYVIPYTISNGIINEMTLYCEHGSLLVKVTPQTKSGGILVLDFSRSIIDPKTNDKDDGRFFVLRDGDEIDYDEIPYSKYRKISIPFVADTQEIEIVQGFVLALKPEMCKITHDPPYSYIIPPLKQFKHGISVDEIKCKSELQKMLKHDETTACVTHETAPKIAERGWNWVLDLELWEENYLLIPPTDYVIKTDTGTYGSQYMIAGATVSNISYDHNANFLKIVMNSPERGILQIVIPSGLLYLPGQAPFSYFVLANGEEIEHENLSPIILKIPFDIGTEELEIIGTFGYIED